MIKVKFNRPICLKLVDKEHKDTIYDDNGKLVTSRMGHMYQAGQQVELGNEWSKDKFFNKCVDHGLIDIYERTADIHPKKKSKQAEKILDKVNGV